MIKFFLGVAVVAFTTFCGFLLSKKYRRRKLFFQQYAMFNQRFLAEITYYKRPIMEFICGEVYKGEFAYVLEEFVTLTQSQVLIRGNLLDNPAFSFLNKEEKRGIEEYFQMLGKGDSVSQKTYFSSMKERIEIQRKTAEEQTKKYGDLYVKIGFLFGLFVLILII